MIHRKGFLKLKTVKFFAYNLALARAVAKGGGGGVFMARQANIITGRNGGFLNYWRETLDSNEMSVIYRRCDRLD